MKKKTAIVVVSASLVLFIAGISWAGAKSDLPVYISINGDSTIVYGSLSTARYSADQKQSIGCTVNLTLPSTFSTTCSATNSTGTSVSCTSTDQNMYQLAKEINSYSMIAFICYKSVINQIGVSNFSNYLP